MTRAERDHGQHELRMRVAGEVLASLDEVPPLAVALLARALRMQGGRLERFAYALEAFGHTPVSERPNELARIRLALALRQLHDVDELIAQLEGAAAPPWPALTAGLRELYVDVVPEQLASGPESMTGDPQGAAGVVDGC